MFGKEMRKIENWRATHLADLKCIDPKVITYMLSILLLVPLYFISIVNTPEIIFKVMTLNLLHFYFGSCGKLSNTSKNGNCM